MNFGLYIHIPFCEQRCHYCAFPISLAKTEAHAPYVDRLIRELELATDVQTPGTLYLGGGTPSLLSSELICRLMKALPTDVSEVSLEVNPGTLDGSKLDLYLDLGINRLSLGAQSFNEADLKQAGRLHKPEDTVRDFENLRKKGFANINLDLIAGLPGQDRSIWERNLAWVEQLMPDHVSIYLLESEEGTLWRDRNVPLQGEDDQAWFYHYATDRLAEIGYVHYEISNWARPGAECRHNIGYWNKTPYRGLGLGAHSFIEELRFWNTRSMENYGRKVDSRELPIENVERLSRAEKLEEAFLLGLRQMKGFNVDDVVQETGIDYPEEWFHRVENLEEARLVEFDGTILKLTRRGWLLATGITEELLCPTLLSICEVTP